MTEFKMDKTAFSVVSMDDPDDSVAYWRTRPPEERLEFHEYLSEVMFGDKAQEGLQRVLEIAQRQRR
jgi:hypothetical protein